MVPTALHGKGLRYKVRYIDPNGDERSKSFPDKQKNKAESFLVEVESDKREGKYVDPNAGKITFKAQAENWLLGYSPDAATRQTVRSRLRSQLYPFFGEMPLSSITPAVIRKWLGSLEEQNLGGTYKAVLFEMACSILNSAVDDKRIQANPCKVRSIVRPQRQVRKVVVWSDERFQAVRGGLPERYRVVTSLGAGCGLRQGEILAFSPDDIEEKAHRINVVRQIRVIDRTLVFAPPKRKKERQVPLSSAVRKSIRDHLKAYPAVPVTLPWGKPSGELVTVNLLLVPESGELYTGDEFGKVIWQPAFKRAGLTYMKRQDGMHAMRHLFASALLSQGVSIKALADYLGHADPGFTLRTYTHLMPSAHDSARAAVDGMLGE
ncbi:tyrosine-type recombinase/integrase [Kutzneria kofuensis]|uniref:Integrase n=2 Tax=Kutzneria kofuensis TaxID=103725 RepID=A0A7W9NHQ6_9PSEU|nr:tyrosine-type recombinase/integrase [Kutzneria kofuensis]MBB5892794.1 integrase [Kutzneria kofuensis]